MTPESLEVQLHQDATSLVRRGHAGEGAQLQKIADDLTAALDPIRLVPEHTAMSRSGKGRRWLADRFDDWVRVNAAAMVGGERHYRLCVLPHQLAAAEGAADAEKALREKSA